MQKQWKGVHFWILEYLFKKEKCKYVWVCNIHRYVNRNENKYFTTPACSLRAFTDRGIFCRQLLVINICKNRN